MKFTYQTRPRKEDDAPVGRVLDACAAVMGLVERRLFADFCAGRSLPGLKGEYIRKYGISARQFSSVRLRLQGRISAVKESQKLRVAELGDRIGRAEQVIDELKRQPGDTRFERHQKSRRLGSLRDRLSSLNAEIAAGAVPLTFGGRRLWERQFDLAGDNYADHAAWLLDWRAARDSEFVLSGSRDEVSGNNSCIACVNDDDTVDLRVRLPDALADEHGKHLWIRRLSLRRGLPELKSALDSCRAYGEYRKEHGLKAKVPEYLGRSVSYRFKRFETGEGKRRRVGKDPFWWIFITIEGIPAPLVTVRGGGAVGVDLNEGHLSVSETDGSGNWIGSFDLSMCTYGKTGFQANAITGDAVSEVIGFARSRGKPVAIEQLDFREKKAELEGESGRRCRMLSSFAYGRFRDYMQSRGMREGVEVVEVNPAFSSFMGRVKYMKLYGLTSHGAAALVLARRLCRYGERLPVPGCVDVPWDGGGHVTLDVPERNHLWHVWRQWGKLYGWWKVAREAHGRRRRVSPPAAGGPGGPAVGGGSGGPRRVGGVSPARKSARTVGQAVQLELAFS